MRKQYLSAPLPFQGQKRMFAKEYIEVLQQFPDGTTFVDLFGGSGLLSHIAKYQKPHSTVVYNDFDGYRQRLEALPVTNALLAELREIVDVPRHKPILGETKERVLSCIRKYLHDYGYIDYITLSSSIMFSMKYATEFSDLEKETLYNNIRTTDYEPCADYLDGLTVLAGHRFIYFTSNKSSIVELCDWMGKHPELGNPFENCQRREFNAHMNYSASYTDIMLYTKAA